MENSQTPVVSNSLHMFFGSFSISFRSHTHTHKHTDKDTKTDGRINYFISENLAKMGYTYEDAITLYGKYEQSEWETIKRVADIKKNNGVVYVNL